MQRDAELPPRPTARRVSGTSAVFAALMSSTFFSQDFTFESGYPTQESSKALYDEMDFQRAVQVYLWSLPLVSMQALHERLEETGTTRYSPAIFGDLLPPSTIVFTGNNTTLYGFHICPSHRDSDAAVDDVCHRALRRRARRRSPEDHAGARVHLANLVHALGDYLRRICFGAVGTVQITPPLPFLYRGFVIQDYWDCRTPQVHYRRSLPKRV